MNFLDSITVDQIVAAVTAVGVLLAFWQLRQAKRQALSAFEDSFSAQYRQLLKDLPVDALLGRRLSPHEQRAALGAFYRYFDLSNEQAFLRSRGRIREDTWNDWREGIEQNTRLPAFIAAWIEIRSAGTGSFDDLASMIGEPVDGPRASITGELTEAQSASRHAEIEVSQ